MNNCSDPLVESAVAAAAAATHPLLVSQGLALQQHMQQLLRQQLSVNPQQLHSLVQQHQQHLSMLYQKQQQDKLADLGRKQLETVMQQLQEQLQLNLIQQSQLQVQNQQNRNAAERRKSSELVQTLAAQQQQLMQQLQLTQRHYLLGLQQQHLLSSPPNGSG